jgi:hypothetical protein
VLILQIRSRIQCNRFIRGKFVARVTQADGVVSWVTSREPHSTPHATLGPREEAAIFHDRYQAALTDIPQMDFGWTLLHATDEECTAVGSVNQEFSGSGKYSEPPRHLRSAANTRVAKGTGAFMDKAESAS